MDSEPVTMLTEEALKLLVSMTITDHTNMVDAMLWVMVRDTEDEYRRKLQLVHYILFTYVRGDLVREGLDRFVMDLFNNPETSASMLSRAHDMYHNLKFGM